MKKFIKKNNKSVSKFQQGGTPIYKKEIYLDKDPGGESTAHGELLSWFPGLTPEERMDETVQELTHQVNPITGNIIRNTYQPTTEQQNLKMIPLSPEEKLAYDVVSSLVTLPIQIGGTKLLLNGASKFLPFIPKIGSVAVKNPRTTSAVMQLGLGATTSAATQGGVDPVTKYMENVGAEFTDNDYNNLSNVANLDDILLWLGKNGYNVTKYTGQKPTINTAYIIHPNENKIFGVDAPIWWDNGAAAALWGLSALKNFKVGKWALPAYIIGSGAVRSAYFGSDRAKARMLANYLTSHGYIDWEGSKNSYGVQTDQSNNPQITDTVKVIPQIQDSAATPTPYNEYQGEVYDQIGEQVNPNYVGFETDTASNE